VNAGVISVLSVETFTTCPDPTGEAAPCRDVGPGYTPTIRLADGTTTACPIWIETRCAIYERMRLEWLDVGRRRKIPERFVAASFVSSRRTPALDAAQAFVKDAARRGRALVLLGPPGCGKTWSVCAATHAWPEHSAVFVEASSFVSELLHWTSASRREHPLDRAAEASFLAFDDLGFGFLKPGGFGESAIEELIHRRHAAMLPTILTSNWTPAQLARRLSPRSVDRLREWSDVVALTGPSLRRG
jgi:DNA replication protein DnaC